MNIGIIGAGSYGTALGGAIEESGHAVTYYDPAKGYDDFNSLIDLSDYIIFCAPAETADEMLPLIPAEKPLVIASKGFLSTEPFDRFEEYMVLSGPGYAADLQARKLTTLTITDEKIRDFLNVEYLKFDFTTDRLGVLLCGALKNAYAILAGFHNLKPGTNEWRAYIDEASLEIKSILEINSADPATFDLACGASDLKLTAAVPSRNYEYGQLLRNDSLAKPTKTVEGITVINKIRDGHEIVIPSTAKYLIELTKIIKEDPC